MPKKHTMAPAQIARLVEAVGGVDATANLLDTSPELVREVMAGERPLTEMQFCQLMIRAATRRPQRPE